MVLFFPFVQLSKGEFFFFNKKFKKKVSSLHHVCLRLQCLRNKKLIELNFFLWQNNPSLSNKETSSEIPQFVLKVIYVLNKGVIGKDSYGKRYHIREPLGQDFRRLNFPSPDDYIPLVKQSRGAVFTLKAFIQNNAKWSKALPLSLSKVLTQQIAKDQKQCKACTCEERDCKDVINQRCL